MDEVGHTHDTADVTGVESADRLLAGHFVKADCSPEEWAIMEYSQKDTTKGSKRAHEVRLEGDRRLNTRCVGGGRQHSSTRHNGGWVSSSE